MQFSLGIHSGRLRFELLTKVFVPDLNQLVNVRRLGPGFGFRGSAGRFLGSGHRLFGLGPGRGGSFAFGFFLMVFSHGRSIQNNPLLDRLIHYRDRGNLELDCRENPLKIKTLGAVPGEPDGLPGTGRKEF